VKAFNNIFISFLVAAFGVEASSVSTELDWVYYERAWVGPPKPEEDEIISVETSDAWHSSPMIAELFFMKEKYVVHHMFMKETCSLLAESGISWRFSAKLGVSLSERTCLVS
jgi:hypothetical protein